MIKVLLASSTALLLVGCSKDDVADTAGAGGDPGYLAPPDPSEGFQLSMTTTAPAYTEVWDCAVYYLPTDEIENVNWIQFKQNSGTHHMTLSTLGLTGSTGLPQGQYPCSEIYGDSSLMQDQIMFYGNQGTAEGEMHLPEGVAATFPAGLEVIHEVHYVNTTDEAVELYSHLNAYTIPDSEVIEGIWGGSVRDEHINIPAASTHTEWSRCVMNRDVEVLFLASHTHELGVEFTIAPFDGETVGDVFYTNDDWHDPKIVQYEEPIVVPEGEGFEWTCTWTNEADQPVNYGLDSTDEMCNLAVVFMPFDMNAACEVVESSDGVLWEG